MSMKIDPDRRLFDALGGTGIFVRAEDEGGAFHTVDVAELTRESLLVWLRSAPTRAEEMVLIMLGHRRATGDIVVILRPFTHGLGIEGEKK
jgi:hypothetical protein